MRLISSANSGVELLPEPSLELLVGGGVDVEAGVAVAPSIDWYGVAVSPWKDWNGDELGSISRVSDRQVLMAAAFFASPL